MFKEWNPNPVGRKVGDCAVRAIAKAIAECEGERHPTANTCIKLAAFYTIKEHLFPEKSQLPEENSIPQLRYSYAAPDEAETTIDYFSDTEFGRLVNGKNLADVWPVIDELMQALEVLNPRLYAGVIRKL